MRFPDPFLVHTGPLIETARPIQGMNSDVTLVVGERGRFILKQALTPDQIKTVATETLILDAIRSHRPLVPTLLASAPGLLLMTLLPGADFVTVQPALTSTDYHRLLAEAAVVLRRIHTWKPTGCLTIPRQC